MKIKGQTEWVLGIGLPREHEIATGKFKWVVSHASNEFGGA